MALSTYLCRWVMVHDVKYCAVVGVVDGSHRTRVLPFFPTTAFSVDADWKFNPGGVGIQFVMLFLMLKPQVSLRVALGLVRITSRRRCADLLSDALCGDCEALARIVIDQIIA
jgi:hypothetical protein